MLPYQYVRYQYCRALLSSTSIFLKSHVRTYGTVRLRYEMKKIKSTCQHIRFLPIRAREVYEKFVPYAKFFDVVCSPQKSCVPVRTYGTIP